MGEDRHAESVLRLHQQSGRKDFDLRQLGIRAHRPHRTLGNPIVQDAVILRILGEARPAAVGDGARRFLQQQTAGRLFAIDAPAESLTRQHEVIGIGIVPPERKLQAPFARQRPVAGPRIAPRPHEDRLNVIGERADFGLLESNDLHRHFHRAARLGHNDVRVAVACRLQYALRIDDGDFRIVAFKFRGVGHGRSRPPRGRIERAQLRECLRPRERHGRGVNDQFPGGCAASRQRYHRQSKTHGRPGRKRRGEITSSSRSRTRCSRLGRGRSAIPKTRERSR